MLSADVRYSCPRRHSVDKDNVTDDQEQLGAVQVRFMNQAFNCNMLFIIVRIVITFNLD